MARQAASAFVLGVVTGLFLKEAVQHGQQFARRTWAHRENESLSVAGKAPDGPQELAPLGAGRL